MSNLRIEWLRARCATKPHEALRALAELAAVDDPTQQPNPVTVERLLGIASDALRRATLIPSKCCTMTPASCQARFDVTQRRCCEKCEHES